MEGVKSDLVKEIKNMYELQTKAIEAARKVLIENLGYQTVEPEDMFIVWFCKTLQNWKAIVSGRTIEEFIEVTHNGDRNETYIDVYCKTKNVCIKGESELKKKAYFSGNKK